MSDNDKSVPAMQAYIRKPEPPVKAVQWHKPGDHPEVIEEDNGLCRWQWIMKLNGMRTQVLPGDWIIFEGPLVSDVVGPDAFAEYYSPVERNPAPAAPPPGAAEGDDLVAAKRTLAGMLEGLPGNAVVEVSAFGGSNDFTAATLRALLAAAEQSEHHRQACIRQSHEIEQILGKALGYPWYKDDPKNFPDATEADGVCVGDHVAESLADEAAERIRDLQGKLAAARLLQGVAARIEGEVADV